VRLRWHREGTTARAREVRIIHAPDIEAWGRQVAAHEAVAIRVAVREALLDGAGAYGALDVVRRRLGRLTAEQREVVVATIGVPSGA
jgi:hypothetical protein